MHPRSFCSRMGGRSPATAGKGKGVDPSPGCLAAQRRRMPWLVIEKDYEFDGSAGKVSFFDLFEGRRQLVVYRAFFELGVSGWPEHAGVAAPWWPTRWPTSPI